MGLRGDPYLWRALRAHLAAQDIPASAGELTGLLHEAFRELVGTDLASDPAASVYREQYAWGGMSSGMISLETWRQQLMPMLCKRASMRLRRQAQQTDPDPTIPDTLAMPSATPAPPRRAEIADIVGFEIS